MQQHDHRPSSQEQLSEGEHSPQQHSSPTSQVAVLVVAGLASELATSRAVAAHGCCRRAPLASESRSNVEKTPGFDDTRCASGAFACRDFPWLGWRTRPASTPPPERSGCGAERGSGSVEGRRRARAVHRARHRRGRRRELGIGGLSWRRARPVAIRFSAIGLELVRGGTTGVSFEHTPDHDSFQTERLRLSGRFDFRGGLAVVTLAGGTADRRAMASDVRPTTARTPARVSSNVASDIRPSRCIARGSSSQSTRFARRLVIRGDFTEQSVH